MDVAQIPNHLFRSELAVAGSAQTRHDVAVVVDDGRQSRPGFKERVATIS
jgi:hypothetical protein